MLELIRGEGLSYLTSCSRSMRRGQFDQRHARAQHPLLGIHPAKRHWVGGWVTALAVTITIMKNDIELPDTGPCGRGCSIQQSYVSLKFIAVPFRELRQPNRSCQLSHTRETLCKRPQYVEHKR